MVTKRKIGIIYRPTDWTGGIYYILNFIQAIRASEKEKPVLLIFCDSISDFEFIRDQTAYSDLRMQLIPGSLKLTFLQRVMNKVSRVFSGRNIFEKRFHEKIDFIFPFSYHEYFGLITNRAYWLPDLQDKFYPEFFDEATVRARDEHYKKLAQRNNVVVFSSEAALKDYRKFYSAASIRPFVLHFASFHKINQLPEKAALLSKYGLPDNFFYSPNQFWRHKNHFVVIEAVKNLKSQGVPVTVAFSGNENDPRSPGYLKELKAKVGEYGLEKEILFLGFIDRQDVFALMKYSLAVIQPSKFEGWSTVVEDALSVNAFLILSDLEVNKEQISENVLFFECNSSDALAGHIKSVASGEGDKKTFDYDARRRKYSEDIFNFIEFTTRNKE